MKKIIRLMFERGVFREEYAGIIDIFPRKAMNSDLFDAALNEIANTHEIIMITPDILRAFKRK